MIKRSVKSDESDNGNVCSLCKNFLEAYGCDFCFTPNFKRLAEKPVRFDNFYVGSMPCMPARRELHTGRYNFLHRGWGPLEPFDDSMPEILKSNGVYTHLVTDHYHYFEDGGCTYHNRYSTWEGFRGQEGDYWKGEVKHPDICDTEKAHGRSTRLNKYSRWRQDWINRKHMICEDDMPQSKTFAAGIEFIETNKSADNWFLQIETFDPHEPFFAQEQYKKPYEHDYNGKHFDWAPYGPVRESAELVGHLRSEYCALVAMCDAKLGTVLDAMDRNDMWEDTMLIINTDHGFLLGEHEWWAKGAAPLYNEIANTPFFIYDPRYKNNGVCEHLSQTIDIAPTLLDFFKIPVPVDMQGKPLHYAYADDQMLHDAVIYGYYGGTINVTDGNHTYSRSPRMNDLNYEYTLMPTNTHSMFGIGQLSKAVLNDGFAFTKGAKVLKIPFRLGHINFHSPVDLLFDLKTDREQKKRLVDDELEARFANIMTRIMRESEAPPEQYERMQLLPEEITAAEIVHQQRIQKIEHLSCDLFDIAQWTDDAKELLHAVLNLLSKEQKDMYISSLIKHIREVNVGIIEVCTLREFHVVYEVLVSDERVSFDISVMDGYFNI